MNSPYLFEGFVHNDMLIINPTVDDGGQEETVSPEVYGFKIVQLGGNITAWRRDLEDGKYILLSDESFATHEFSDTFVLSVYADEEDDQDGLQYPMIVGNYNDVGGFNFANGDRIKHDGKFGYFLGYSAAEEGVAHVQMDNVSGPEWVSVDELTWMN